MINVIHDAACKSKTGGNSNTQQFSAEQEPQRVGKEGVEKVAAVSALQLYIKDRHGVYDTFLFFLKNCSTLSPLCVWFLICIAIIK